MTFDGKDGSARLETRFTRRRLPHLRAIGATYFVTWRLAQGEAELAGVEREVVAGAIRHFDGIRYALDAFVVMNDHVHVVVEPREGVRLSKILQSWKGFTANTLQRSHAFRQGAVWQDESHNRVMRSQEEMITRARYVARNPFRRWPTLEHYEWCWIDPLLVVAQ